MSNDKLFCCVCREELAVKKSVIEQHIKSRKHQQGKETLQSKAKREVDNIAKSLKEYDAKHQPSGETLPECTRLYRIRVLEAFLKAGVPLLKIDIFRGLLEEHGYSLSDSSNLRKMIPFILESEIKQIKESIHISVIFEGTTHVCEALVVVVRYVDDDWVIQEKVCRLMLLAKSLSGEEVARQLITALSTQLSVPAHLVLAFMRDRAAVNGVAMRTVSILYNKMIDIGCFSHTLDLVWQKMNIPILSEFVKHWISLFSHSPKTRLAWKEQTSLPVPSYSATMHRIHDSFGDVDTFVRNEELPTATASKLISILDDQPKCHKLKMELAITIDAMELFVKTTYTLEGDGPLALSAYEHVKALYSHVTLEHYPNTAAVAKQLAAGNVAHEGQLMAYAKNCVTEAYDYFRSKFESELNSAMEAFKAARYLSPAKVNSLKPNTSDIDSIKAFPFVDSEAISELKSELPAYLAAAEDVSHDFDALQWWKNHADTLPKWSSVCRSVLLVQPSSAAAERVFSLLSSAFNWQQESALEDYVQLSVLLQYNNRKQ